MGGPDEDVGRLAGQMGELRRELQAQREAVEILRKRAADAEGRLEDLTRALDEAQRRIGDGRSLEVEATSELATEASSERSAPTPEEPFVSPEAVPAAAEVEEAPDTTLETKIGAYWFNRLGALSVLVGFIVFAGWVNKYMTPAMRVGLGYVGALILIAVGVLAGRRYPRFSRPLLAAGMMLAFFTSFAGHFIRPMRCLSQEASTILMLAVAVGVVAFAGARRSQPLGGLALAMGFWVAVFATKLSDGFTPIMLIFLAMAGVGFLLVFRWVALMALTVVGVYSCHTWWYLVAHESGVTFTEQMVYLSIYFGVFLFGDVVNRLSMGPDGFLTASKPWTPTDWGILAGRSLNPCAYVALGTIAFWHTKTYWSDIHFYYWPVGVLLAAVATLGWFIDRRQSFADDLLYVLSCGLITLGLASYFETMSLSNVLALEGLCLFLIRLATGRAVFAWLSVLIYAVAFFHFNLVSYHDLKPGPVTATDWRAFVEGLPTVLFVLLPTFIVPFWRGKPSISLQDSEEPIMHVRAFGGSVLLLRLIFQAVLPEVAFGIWTALAIGGLAAAYFWRAARAMPTLAVTFGVWAHLYLYFQLGPIERGEPGWMFPSAIVLTLLVLATELLAERAAGRIAAGRHTESAWLFVAGLLMLICSADVVVLNQIRTEPLFQYPVAMACAFGLLVPLLLRRIAIPAAAGAVLIVVYSILRMLDFLNTEKVNSTHFLVWTLLCVGLTIAFERVTRAWSKRRVSILSVWWPRISLALVALVTLMLLGLLHFGDWITEKYETVGMAGIAAVLLGLGIAMRSGIYRRFGLGVFVLALGRAYAIDLHHLETFYKIVAFIVLGGVLIVVSFLYTRFRESFHKWI